MDEFGRFHGQLRTRNLSGDEIANVNFIYDDIARALQNTIDSLIASVISLQIGAVMCCNGGFIGGVSYGARGAKPPKYYNLV